MPTLTNQPPVAPPTPGFFIASAKSNLVFSNSSESLLKVTFEPWAHEFSVAPKQMVEMVFDAGESSVTIEKSQDGIVVWAEKAKSVEVRKVSQ